MSITSYAQNFEDVMLWRALEHVTDGFYVDVGAQHPVIDSVSKAFYENGWRGVHVEATPTYAELLRVDRPDELVLQVALSDRSGLMTFYEIADTGLSTGDSSIAEHHRAAGYSVVETTTLCITLADVLTKAGPREIHWLKIDVEGMESKVIDGWGDIQVRPWIVVVESTYPNSQVETHLEWEHALLEKGYAYAWFDGLSRFYVHANHFKLGAHFHAPPNVFDKFALAVSAPYCASGLHTTEQRLRTEIAAERDRLNQEIEVLQDGVARRDKELATLAGQAKERLARQQQAHANQLARMSKSFEQKHERLTDHFRATLQESQNALRETQVVAAEAQSDSSRTTTRLLQQLESASQRHAARETALSELLSHAVEERTVLNEHVEALKGNLTSAVGLNQRLKEDRVASENASAARLQQEADRHEKFLAALEAAFKAKEHSYITQLAAAEDLRIHHAEELARIEHALSAQVEAYGELKQQYKSLLENSIATERTSRERVAHLTVRLSASNEALQQVENSLLWRMTSPFRSLKPENPDIGFRAETVEPMAKIPSNQYTMANDLAKLDDLLLCEGEHFIQQAYRAVLGRYPDPEGSAYYGGRLQKGYPKIQILAQLKLSREGAGKTIDLPGLDAAIRRYKRSRYPVIGRVLALTNEAGAAASAEIQFARLLDATSKSKDGCLAGMVDIENRLTQLINARVDTVEARLSELRNATEHRADALASRVEAALHAASVARGLNEQLPQSPRTDGPSLGASDHLPLGLLVPRFDYEATHQVQPYANKIFSQLKFHVARQLERTNSADRH